MRLRYAGTCSACNATLPAGVLADYHRAKKSVSCPTCPSSAPSDAEVSRPPESSIASADLEVAARGQLLTQAEPVQTGVGGASAQREYERRRDNRDARIRAEHRWLGGFILAVTAEPQSTKAWAVGAKGEETLARGLDNVATGGLALLHDRQIPRSRANIDHIAIARSGVFVIDAKRYQGRPHLRVDGGLLRPRVETLMVGRRDCSKLVHGVQKQLALVRDVLARDALGRGVPTQGMLCFVDGDWPILGGSFTIDGLEVLWPRRAQEHLTRPGPLTTSQIQTLHGSLATAFPPA